MEPTIDLDDLDDLARLDRKIRLRLARARHLEAVLVAEEIERQIAGIEAQIETIDRGADVAVSRRMWVDRQTRAYQAAEIIERFIAREQEKLRAIEDQEPDR